MTGAGVARGGNGIVEFAADLRVSRFTVQAFAGGMLSALGHSPTFAARDYRAAIHCNPETGEGASITLTIKARSLELTDDYSTKDRKTIEQTMQSEVLESDTFAEIIYTCPASSAVVRKNGDAPFELTLNGQLMLHGVTRPLRISAHAVVSPAMLRAYGEFPVLQSDFGIKQVNVAGGALKVKDELKCAFDIVGRPVDAAAS